MSTLTESEVRGMRVSDLKKELRSRSLSVSGKKAILIDRLLEYIEENESENEIEPQESVEDDIEELLNDNNDFPSDNANFDNTTKDDDIDRLLDEHDDDDDDVNTNTTQDTKVTNNSDENNNDFDNNTTSNNNNHTISDFESPKTSKKFLNDFEKMIKKQERIARFGVTNPKDKIALRQQRFGTQTKNGNKNNTDFSVHSLMNGSDNKNETFSMEILEKRRQRWGDEAISLSIAKEKAGRSKKFIDVDEEIRKEERKNRFGTGSDNDNIDTNIKSDKQAIQDRMKRFGTTVSNGKTKTNDNIITSDNEFDDTFKSNRMNRDDLLDMSLDELAQRNRNRNRRGRGRGRRGRGRGRGGSRRGGMRRQGYNNRNNRNTNFSDRSRRGRFNRRGQGNEWRDRRNQNRDNTRSRSRRQRQDIDNDMIDNNSNNFEGYDNILQRGDVDRQNDPDRPENMKDFADDFDEVDYGDDDDDELHVDDMVNDFDENNSKKQARYQRFEKDWKR